jgi:SAM-dependent methyltransferase
VSDETERFWEDFYRAKDGVWSGKANALLVEEVAALAPGTALDLGCGEGGDAIWLAAQGWRVTAVDVSATALERGAGHAADAGVTGVIAWERHDLTRSFPAGAFDLVAACYLHSRVPLDRGRVLRAAAAAVAPGGSLVVVGHAGMPSWAGRGDGHGVDFPTPQEVLDDLALPAGAWVVARSEVVSRRASAPGGAPGTREDNVLRLTRRA